MSDLLYEVENHICWLTLNRVNKHNAFDNLMLLQMQTRLNEAIADPQVRVIVLKANGTHFSAGADLSWMQDMAHYSKEENITDAMILANLMFTLYQSPKPTIAMIQGSAFGGGAGFAAVCDVAIAASNARFCFSEVKLGLIPAVISPYVVQAIGKRQAKALFMSAEVFDAAQALASGLVQRCVPEEILLETTLNYATQISTNAPEAVCEAKKLALDVAGKTIDKELIYYTATQIAQKRVSAEGQLGLNAFLNKKTPNWN